MVYSIKQHLFLVVYEFSGSANEVVLYWENTNAQPANNKGSTIKGMHLSNLFVADIAHCFCAREGITIHQWLTSLHFDFSRSRCSIYWSKWKSICNSWWRQDWSGSVYSARRSFKRSWWKKLITRRKPFCWNKWCLSSGSYAVPVWKRSWSYLYHATRCLRKWDHSYLISCSLMEYDIYRNHTLLQSQLWCLLLPGAILALQRWCKDTGSQLQMVIIYQQKLKGKSQSSWKWMRLSSR